MTRKEEPGQFSGCADHTGGFRHLAASQIRQLLGDSCALHAALERVRRSASTDATVLIEG